MAEEEKRDEETPQQEGNASFITIFFEGPGSARIAGLRTGEVSLNQIALAGQELQRIADFEQWWGAYSSRMDQMEKAERQRMEEAMIRQALMQGGRIKPS